MKKRKKTRKRRLSSKTVTARGRKLRPPLQTLLPHGLVKRLFFGKYAAQPGRIVDLVARDRADLLQCLTGAQHIGVRRNPLQRRNDVFGNRPALAGLRIDAGACEAKPARLETVEGVDEVIVFFGREGFVKQQMACQRLDVAGDRGGAIN